jgi:hypothetical protein
MLTPTVEFIDERDIVLPPPVKKLIWNGTEFVPFLLYRRKGVPSNAQLEWLWHTYGRPGVYKYGRHWDYSDSGDITYMDDKVYMFYTMKWGAK